MCCVDGSDMGHQAFELIELNFFRKQDNLIVSHVFNKGKSYLPLNMKPEYVRQVYDAELT